VIVIGALIGFAIEDALSRHNQCRNETSGTVQRVATCRNVSQRLMNTVSNGDALETKRSENHAAGGCIQTASETDGAGKTTIGLLRV